MQTAASAIWHRRAARLVLPAAREGLAPRLVVCHASDRCCFRHAGPSPHAWRSLGTRQARIPTFLAQRLHGVAAQTGILTGPEEQGAELAFGTAHIKKHTVSGLCPRVNDVT